MKVLVYGLVIVFECSHCYPTPACWVCTTDSDIFTPPLGGVKTPQSAHDPPPPFLVFFKMFLMFFNVNLLSKHVYTPRQMCVYPPNFKFLEITLTTDNAF